MNQLLDILNGVMRIATFQWHGETLHRCRSDRRYAASHHAPWADRQPTRCSRS